MKPTELKTVALLKSRSFQGLWRASCVLFCLWLSVEVLAQNPRRFVPQDLLELEGIGEIAISPDGRTVAYVRRRTLASMGVQQRETLSGSDRADIWLAPVAGGSPTNITKGEADGSGYWMPKWSPDSQHLAMLSTKGGDNVRLWVWDKATGGLKKLSERGVVAEFVFDPWAWLDNQRLVAILLPEGEKLWAMNVYRQSAETATREWPKAWAGRESTASVLDSGVQLDPKARPQMQWTILDMMGHVQSVVPTADWASLRSLPLSIAPDNGYIAFSKLIALPRPDSTKLLQNFDRLGFGKARYQFSIADASGRVVMEAAKGVRFVVLDSFRWSRDSRNFAFIGVKEGDDEDSLQIFRGKVDGEIQVVPLSSCDPRSLIWASGDRLLVSSECYVSRSDSIAKRRIDWWLATPNASSRNLTESFKTAPAALVADPTGHAFLGVAAGDLWKIDLDSGEWMNLTQKFAPTIAGIAWPSESTSQMMGRSKIILSVSSGQTTDYYRMDVASDSITQIARPSDLATLVAYYPENDKAIFSAMDRTGFYLTLVMGDERRTLVEMNTQLRDIAEGESRLIKYRSLDGQELKAWLTLPPDYQSGKRYPLVTWVYAGSMAGDAPSAYTQLGSPYGWWVNLQLLAARGYAVLIPSMPLKPQPDGKDNPGSDPLLELTKGVLPAVDKVIELGIADPQRLAVGGHSYGGYTTYGLVTQTNRFKAAIASSGFTDSVSLYGTFFTPFRYESYSQEVTAMQSTAETSQQRMGNPPWKDWGRYLRNSPIFYADRVETPLLIVHGDMDVFPIQQAEEFFTALFRQNKRARFIRYWGEGHVLSSPANIRDVWTQIYAWLDEFCDISRDAKGNLVFDGDKVKSRNGAPPLKPADFARFNEMELRSHPWIKQ